MKDKFGLTAQQEITIEILNALTHALGVVLSILATYLLVLKTHFHQNNLDFWAYLIYGLSMIGLFSSSTLYHSFSFSKYRKILQKIDHSAIYLLIAGTYTPFVLLGLTSPYRFGIFAIIWICAVCGMLIEIMWLDKLGSYSTYIYLAMGWLVVFFIIPLYQNTPHEGIFLLAIGGIIYSLGTIFYRRKHNKWMHVIWHLFVLGGAISMFLSIFYYL